MFPPISHNKSKGIGLILGVGLYLLSTQVWAHHGNCGYTGGDWKKGDKIFHETCFVCHGENGKGAVPGAPDFTKKGGPLSHTHKDITRHILNGFQEPGKPLAMPAKGGNPGLTLQDIKNVHAYLHHEFGCGKGE